MPPPSDHDPLIGQGHGQGDAGPDWRLLASYVRLLNRLAGCRAGSLRHTILARGLMHPRLAAPRRRYGLDL